jgi:hypothetical protein
MAAHVQAKLEAISLAPFGAVGGYASPRQFRAVRQIWRITILLLRIKRQAREEEPIEIPRGKPEY